MIIIDYYQNLSDQDKKRFRIEVIEKTGWSYPTFFRKLRVNNFTKLETTAIESLITTKKIIDDEEN